MNSKFYLFCDRPSKGGTAFIRALGGKRIRNVGSKFVPKKGRVVINWGSSKLGGHKWQCLNAPKVIELVSNKLKFFKHVSNKLTVPFTEDAEVAKKWLQDGFNVMCRTVLNGHSGKGIVYVSYKKKNDFVEAPLYTLYTPKDEEYRIHVIKDQDGNPQIFYEQKKVKRLDYDGEHNRKIRNHENGYVYQHNNINVPSSVRTTALKVFMSTGLDFGAVDIIYCRGKKNPEYERALALEINTAPGLEGVSLQKYSEAFKQYYSEVM